MSHSKEQPNSDRQDEALDLPWPTEVGDVRPGEELPITRLEDYLRREGVLGEGRLAVRQFPHGHSNLTYLLRQGTTDWVLRRPPFGTLAKSAHDMGRECRVLQPLAQVYPPAPKPIHFCEDLSILGVPFYLMEHRAGRIFRHAEPTNPWLIPSHMESMCESLVTQLVALHAIDWEKAGLSGLGKPIGYGMRQVDGWIKRFAAVQYQAMPEMEQVAVWLRAKLPAEQRGVLIHNDFKFDNVVFDEADPTRIVAVLDWEMATLGDPWFDVGTTLGYWLEAGEESLLGDSIAGPTTLPGAFTRQAFVDRYCAMSGRRVTNWEYYLVFGLFKIAVIILQIYVRYRDGATSDSRFANLDDRVFQLGKRALHLIRCQGD